MPLTPSANDSSASTTSPACERGATQPTEREAKYGKYEEGADGASGGPLKRKHDETGS